MAARKRSQAWLQCNRAIRAAVAQGGLTDDDRKSIVMNVAGKASMADCTDREMASILEAVNKAAPAVRREFRRSSKSYVRKIFGLWAEAGKAGAIRHANRDALLAYVNRMTKSEKRPEGISDLGQLEWITFDEAEPIIEGLKAMNARAKQGAEK
ncbi:MAG: regulatory protein GemA [Rhodospirillales bacterium]